MEEELKVVRVSAICFVWELPGVTSVVRVSVAELYGARPESEGGDYWAFHTVVRGRTQTEDGHTYDMRDDALFSREEQLAFQDEVRAYIRFVVPRPRVIRPTRAQVARMGYKTGQIMRFVFGKEIVTPPTPNVTSL